MISNKKQTILYKNKVKVGSAGQFISGELEGFGITKDSSNFDKIFGTIGILSILGGAGSIAVGAFTFKPKLIGIGFVCILGGFYVGFIQERKALK